MTEIMNDFPVFLLIFVRVATFFMIVPILSYRNVPPLVRIGIAFFVALPVYFATDPEPVPVDGLYFLQVVKEVLVGLGIGLIANLIMGAIQTAGGIIDFQMGFAMANVVDPLTGAQSPITGQYLYIYALLFLLATDGHHLLIDAIFHSYQFVPLGKANLHAVDGNFMTFIARSFATMFLIAIQLAIPIVASILMLDIALGILARTVPQLNIFNVGFPVKILSGFILLFLVMGMMILAVEKLFDILLYAIRDFMIFIGP